jgi:uncharacterized iron-regulated membrane protein
MMLRYSLLLVTGLMLGGCCLSGNCYAPVAGSAPAAGPTGVATTSAPDGLGPALTDEAQADVPAKPRKTAQRRRDTVGESEASAASRYRGDTYDQQEAADRADEARLKRKLIICQNCGSTGN